MSENWMWFFIGFLLIGTVLCTDECGPEPGSILDRALPQVEEPDDER